MLDPHLEFETTSLKVSPSGFVVASGRPICGFNCRSYFCERIIVTGDTLTAGGALLKAALEARRTRHQFCSLGPRSFFSLQVQELAKWKAKLWSHYNSFALSWPSNRQSCALRSSPFLRHLNKGTKSLNSLSKLRARVLTALSQFLLHGVLSVKWSLIASEFFLWMHLAFSQWKKLGTWSQNCVRLALSAKEIIQKVFEGTLEPELKLERFRILRTSRFLRETRISTRLNVEQLNEGTETRRPIKFSSALAVSEKETCAERQLMAEQLNCVCFPLRFAPFSARKSMRDCLYVHLSERNLGPELLNFVHPEFSQWNIKHNISGWSQGPTFCGSHALRKKNRQDLSCIQQIGPQLKPEQA